MTAGSGEVCPGSTHAGIKAATLRGYPLSRELIQAAFSDICAIQLDDGIEFTIEHITPIRGNDKYGGYCLVVVARYEGIHTPLKVDITTGDVITPGAVRSKFPSNFENKDIEIWAYTNETILADKIETIFRRSVLNTKPGNFYDVHILLKTQQRLINRDVLSSALQATSEKRMSLTSLLNSEAIILAIRSDVNMRQR